MKAMRLILCLLFLFFSTGYAQITINGVCWATSNVDMPGTFAANPENAGMFYQWGSNVGWSSSNPLTASDGINIWRNLSETGDVWLPEKNPCPIGWRLPTRGEIESLALTYNYWGNLNGVGGSFWGTDEPRLFMPATGTRGHGDGTLYYVGEMAFYLSSTIDINNHDVPFTLWIQQNFSATGCFLGTRSAGSPIRCVADQNEFDVAFYANDVHHEDLTDTTFCNKNVNFRAEIEGIQLHPDEGSLKWFIDYGSGEVEEDSARDQKQWSKPFENGIYPVRILVRFENNETTSISGILKIQALGIKIRNVRY